MLFGRHFLAAVWFYSSDVSRSIHFYRDILGLPALEVARHYAHFDAGGIRLSIHRHDGAVRARGSFFVFVVKRSVDGVVRELKKRGVRFARPVKNYEFGRAAYFYDPDGHELWVWQLPRRGDVWYEDEKVLVNHYEKISRRLRLKENRQQKTA